MGLLDRFRAAAPVVAGKDETAHVNELFQRHQLAQLYARTAAEAPDREIFADLEIYYERRLSEWRSTLGVDAFDAPLPGLPAGDPPIQPER